MYKVQTVEGVVYFTSQYKAARHVRAYMERGVVAAMIFVDETEIEWVSEDKIKK
jgi:hypothetical protein